MEPKESALLQHVEQQMEPYYQSLDEAHDLRHVRRVLAFAEYLQGIEGGELFLIRAGAWLHQLHDDLERLDELLEAMSIDTAQAKQLRQLVFVCRPHRISPHAPIEARIVFDADALDLMGPYGAIRELVCNVHARGLCWEEAVANARAVQQEFLEKITTAAARELAMAAVAVQRDFWSQYDRWKELAILPTGLEQGEKSAD